MILRRYEILNIINDIEVLYEERYLYKKDREMRIQKTSIEGKLEICAEEGIVIERYKDSIGVWTIGVGVTKAAGARIDPTKYRGEISVVEAYDMMESILPKYEKIVEKLLDGKQVEQHVFDALVGAAYNIGPKFARGKQTRALISEGKYREALTLWKRAGGRVSPSLLARRNREADLCETGVYHGKIIPVYDAKNPGSKPRKIYDLSRSEMRSKIEWHILSQV